MLSRLSNLQAIQKRLRMGHAFLASGEELEPDDLLSLELNNEYAKSAKGPSELKEVEKV